MEIGIRGFYNDDGIIKVITGVRRCGKSCFMQTIKQEIMSRGEGGFSIFITGSNSYLLSGELSTKLTGRYVEFEMQTLNFREYCDMKRFLGQEVDANPATELDSYILSGGFPKALDYPKMADKRAYVSSVINEIFERDIRRRVKIKNMSLFNLVRDYVINNFGSTTSLSNMLADLKARQSVTIKRETLNRYLQILEDAKIISKCSRFNMKSRKPLQGEQKCLQRIRHFESPHEP